MSDRCKLIPESGFCLFQYKLLEQPRESKDQRHEAKCETEAFIWAQERKCNGGSSEVTGQMTGYNERKLCSDFNMK